MLVLAAAPPHYLFLPISLNSWSRACEIAESPWLTDYFQKPVAGAGDTSAGDATDLKEEIDEDLVRCVVSFPVDQ